MPDPITIAGAASSAVSVLQTVNDFKARVDSSGGSADSLIAYTKPARAEPVTLIDARAQSLPYVRDVLNSLLSMYAGYYLQAVQLMVGVDRINVINMLDRLNPDRSGPGFDPEFAITALGDLAKKSHMFNKESYAYGLPFPKEPVPSLECYAEGLDPDAADRFVASLKQRQLSLEAKEMPDKNEPLTERGMKVGGKTIDQITEVPNLAVGKMLELVISQQGVKAYVGSDGKEKTKEVKSEATIPVMVRLITNLIPPDVLVHILSDGVKDSGFKERWHAWRSGAISLADMLFAVDAIDAHRKVLMHDKSGSYAEIQRRRRNNGLVTLRSGIGIGGTKTSIGTASNLVVMTEDTLTELEHAAGMRFSNAAQRNRVFEQSYLMIIAVIDTQWEHVTFYSRGIALPTQVSVAALQNANKGKGPDVAEILKAYRLGNNPTL